ncbi:hypothetical protein GCM10010193_32960 [Kitasatospora atroaurantiaca]
MLGATPHEFESRILRTRPPGQTKDPTALRPGPSSFRGWVRRGRRRAARGWKPDESDSRALNPLSGPAQRSGRGAAGSALGPMGTTPTDSRPMAATTHSHRCAVEATRSSSAQIGFLLSPSQ